MLSTVDELLDRVVTAAGEALGLDPDDVDPDTGFFDLGMDSRMALTMCDRLQRETGLDLAATVTFEYPDCASLARHVADELTRRAAAPADGAPRTTDGPARPAGGSPQPTDGAAQRAHGLPHPTAVDDAVASDAADEPDSTDDEVLGALLRSIASAEQALAWRS